MGFSSLHTDLSFARDTKQCLGGTKRHLARLVGDKGLEPLREHMILSHARLPIPPTPHIAPAYIYEKRYAKTSVSIDLRKGLYPFNNNKEL